MIASSQISLFQENTRQVSAFERTQLRINQQPPVPPRASDNAEDRFTLTNSQGAAENTANPSEGDRIEAIRSALEKLNEIREKQKAFIEQSRESAKPESPIDAYLKLIDKLRLELLNSQDEKKQAASRYLEFARL